MAGNYPDVPGPRMAYHLDGSLVFTNNTDFNNTSDEQDSAIVTDLNDEGTAGVLTANLIGVGIIFPELRDIAGICITTLAIPGGGPLEWSSDTTNGVDGTWSAAVNPFPASRPSPVAMREQITALSLNGVRALRFATGADNDNELVGIHIYGQIANAELDQRLRLWHPTNDAPLTGAYFDWGDIARGSTDTLDFRVKNWSTVMTATDVVVGLSHPSDATPSLATQTALSTASSATEENSKNLGSLAPEAISEVITLHRSQASDAALSLWWSLITAAPSHWDP